MIRIALASALFLPACGSSSDEPTPIPTEGTWARADSPFLIEEDLTIAQGASLTIEAGVRVELSGAYAILVEGELIARGSEAEPITFTSTDPSSSLLRWNSIVFADTSVDAEYIGLDDYAAGSVLEHCVFERAYKAVRISAASPFVHRSTFRDNESDRTAENAGGAAIEITDGSTARISECTFTNNVALPIGGGGAIYVRDADPIIQDNQFSGNNSIYGGAVTTDLMASPIVGNLFEDNTTETKGGGLTIVSTASAIINNEFTGNHASKDGGGVHVCVDCFPHATPFLLDNRVTDNTSAASTPQLGAAGVGAAYLRVMANNSITGNLRAGEPSDFGWFHELAEGYPAWVHDRSIAHNWWGTTDADELAATVFDGSDDAAYGQVTVAPALTAAPGEAQPRVTITTRKLIYEDAGDPMPVFLTIYNPGDERDVELALLLQYGEGPTLIYQGALDFPGASAAGGTYQLSLPANSVYFTTLLAPEFVARADVELGYWHAALFDAVTGTRIGEVCSVRYQLGLDGQVGPALVTGVGVEVGGDRVAVGDTYASMGAALGAPGRVRNLGALGVFFAYPGQGLAGLATGSEGTDTIRSFLGTAEFTGQTDDGVAIGNTRTAVESNLGIPGSDPFLGSWWYGELGYAFESNGDAAARIHVF